MTSCSKQSELIAQTSEQESCLRHTPPAEVATTHKNVLTKVLTSPATSRKKLPVSERKSHPPGHQEFPVNILIMCKFTNCYLYFLLIVIVVVNQLENKLSNHLKHQFI